MFTTGIIATWLAKRVGARAAEVILTAGAGLLILALVFAMFAASYMVGSHHRGVTEALKQAGIEARHRDEADAIRKSQAGEAAKIEARNAENQAAVNVPVADVAARIRERVCRPVVVRVPAAIVPGDGLPVPPVDPGSPVDAESAATDPDAGFADNLAEDVRAAKLNSVDLGDLQALIRAHTAPE